MDAFLFSIAPNDLENLMLDAESMGDIEQAPYKQQQIDLGGALACAGSNVQPAAFDSFEFT